jgi:hypothetical protein
MDLGAAKDEPNPPLAARLSKFGGARSLQRELNNMLTGLPTLEQYLARTNNLGDLSADVKRLNKRTQQLSLVLYGIPAVVHRRRSP